MNEISTTNGPQGTVTHKTKSSLAKAAKQGDGSFDKQHTSNQPSKRYRPVRKRTVRSETNKDKACALPPSVYATINQPL